MSTTMITLPADHNYLASLPDGTRDELVLRADGVAVLVERVGKVSPPAFFSRGTTVNGKGRWPFHCPGFLGSKSSNVASYFFCNKFKYGTRNQTYVEDDNTISDAAPESDAALIYSAETALMTLAEANAWLAANPIEVYYAFAVLSYRYSADNGTTWSTTDPAAGTSAIPLRKGTNNIWCTDRLSPTIMLNYNTQERTRKRRISELYWMGNEPKKRLTWGQLATHTWRDIGSKSVQEWYFSGTAEVVENAYINYEIGEL